MSNRKYTVKPDKQDERDYKYSSTQYKSVSDLPSEVDLRPYLSPVVDQGSLGSCTANAIASGLREYIQIKDGKPLTRLSRLYLYWHEREIEGTVNIDSGASIRDGFRVLQQLGCAPEVDCPYDISKFTVKPSAQAEINAAKFKITEYHRVMNYNDLIHALAEQKPVVLGISVYDSFESYNANLTGMIPVPKPAESLLGYHAVLACGYRTFKDGVQYILVRNSWGENWAQFGYCWIPKEFFDKGFVMDMWTGSVFNPSPSNLTVDQSIDLLASKGIFDSPDFWKNLSKKYENDNTSDFRYVRLAIQKVANYISDKFQ